MVAALLCTMQLTLSADICGIDFNNFSWDDIFYEVDDFSYLGIDTGYRYDKISNRAVLYGPTTDVFASTLEAKDVQSYILGVKGQYEFCRLLVKGNYHHGWVLDGSYLDGSFRGDDLGGHTNDASVALGFVFITNKCLISNIYAGWSYDELNFKAKDVTAPAGGVIVPIGDIRYRSRLNGPWIGTDIILRPTCETTVTIGTEAHWAEWNGKRLLPGADLGTGFGEITGFSNRFNHHHFTGAVFRLEGAYAIDSCLDLGLNFKFQGWTSSGRGRFSRVSTPLPTTFDTNNIIDLKWTSFSATAYIDYVF